MNQEQIEALLQKDDKKDNSSNEFSIDLDDWADLMYVVGSINLGPDVMEEDAEEKFMRFLKRYITKDPRYVKLNSLKGANFNFDISDDHYNMVQQDYIWEESIVDESAYQKIIKNTNLDADEIKQLIVDDQEEVLQLKCDEVVMSDIQEKFRKDLKIGISREKYNIWLNKLSPEIQSISNDPLENIFYKKIVTDHDVIYTNIILNKGPSVGKIDIDRFLNGFAKITDSKYKTLLVDHQEAEKLSSIDTINEILNKKQVKIDNRLLQEWCQLLRPKLNTQSFNQPFEKAFEKSNLVRDLAELLLIIFAILYILTPIIFFIFFQTVTILGSIYVLPAFIIMGPLMYFAYKYQQQPTGSKEEESKMNMLYYYGKKCVNRLVRDLTLTPIEQFYNDMKENDMDMSFLLPENDPSNAKSFLEFMKNEPENSDVRRLVAEMYQTHRTIHDLQEKICDYLVKDYSLEELIEIEIKPRTNATSLNELFTKRDLSTQDSKERSQCEENLRQLQILAPSLKTEYKFVSENIDQIDKFVKIDQFVHQKDEELENLWQLPH